MRTTAAFLIILVCANASKGQKPKPKPKSPPKPDVTVTAEELQKDYADNGVAADRKYRRKTLEVTGKIRKIGRLEMSSSTYLTFETEGDLVVLAYFFKEHEDLLLKVKRGDTVAVIGFGAGLTRDKKIWVSRCSALKKIEER
jgi:hypothetical protein